jgi:hypothetical protein
MDLNYLYHRHQVSLFNADNAACDEARRAHLSLVASYAARIEEFKRGDRRIGLVA